MKLLIGLMFALVSASASADIVKALPASDQLGKTAKAIGTQLRDGNISTGTTELWAGKLKESLTSKHFPELVRQGFIQAYKTNTGNNWPKNAEIRAPYGKFVDGDEGDVIKLTDAIMESNDYNTDNGEIWTAQSRYVWVVLRKLPVNENTVLGHVTVKITDENGDKRTVRYFLLVGEDNKAVQLFTIQGSM